MKNAEYQGKLSCPQRDLLFAEIVAKRIAKNPALKLIAAIPYRRQLDTLNKSERTKSIDRPLY